MPDVNPNLDERANAPVPAEGNAGEAAGPDMVEAQPHGQRVNVRHGRDVRSRDQRHALQPYGDEDDNRWSASDFRQLVRMCSDPDKSVIVKGLRRLHLRWFHATIAQMHRLLSLVGIPHEAMKLIPEVVDTCRICRTMFFLC